MLPYQKVSAGVTTHRVTAESAEKCGFKTAE